jgi:signal transduction histidine kinase
VVALAMLAVTHHFSSRYQQEAAQRLNRDLAAHVLSEQHLLQAGRVDVAALEKVFHMVMAINPSIEVYLLDARGRLLAFSDPEGKVRRASVDMRPIRDFLSDRSGRLILGDDPRDPAGRKIFSAASIAGSDGVQGYLYVILASQAASTVMQGMQASYALRASAWTIAMAFAAALGVGLAAMFTLTRPLRRLAREVAAFKRREDGAAAAAASGAGDEIAQLFARFRQMAARIESQMQELRQLDAGRRERVAKLSHDLRTSLTSLQGYLETLQEKNSRLGDAERARFLDIAVKHSRRLATLVGDFFELAKLEYRDAAPRRERFSLSELSRDVVHKFQPAAAARGVRLEGDASAGLCLVDADIGMMERVLSNLLDNALKFTPAGGSVRLRLEKMQGQIRVAVDDTGSGIEPARLHALGASTGRGPTPQPADPDGSGFGLAIVKRILALHGSVLAVQSTVGRGSCFSFSLPAAMPEPLPAPVMEM